MTDTSQPIPYSLADYLRAERVKLLYSHLPIQLVAQFCIMLLLVYLFWDIVPHAALICLGLTMTVYVVTRAFLYRRYRCHSGDIDDAERWGRYTLIGSTVAGCIWGVTGLLLYVPDRLDYQLFILFILAGNSSAALASVSIDLRVFYAFFLTSFMPVTVYQLLQGGQIQMAVGLACVLYIFVTMLFSRNVHHSFVESVKLRYELNRQKIEAERASLAKSRFLAADSHDLRQPLHALSLFSSALQERIRYPDVRRIVDSMDLSINALGNLFAGLLDISKLDAGTLQPEIGSFSMQPLLDCLAHDYTHLAEKKGLSLNCEPCSVVVESDPTMLERILRNLLINAIAYTKSGQVAVRCISQPKVLRIEVSDTGAGIAERDLDEIFEEFTQLNNPERDRSKGMGLGLAIVKRTAALLQHRIDVRSKLGEGSVFAVEVPYGDAATQADSIPSLPGHGDLHGLFVLVIDDERGVREGMQVLFEGWGCRLASFASAEEALAQLSPDEPPDTILADYRLRDSKTGVDAIRELLGFYGRDDIPALIITGDTAPDRIREAQASGYTLLHKPLAPAKLRAYLQHVQRKKSPHDE